MSRIGKKIIEIPKGVSCNLNDKIITVIGKLGEIKLLIPSEITVNFLEEKIFIKPNNKAKQTIMLWGTIQSLISNIIYGVCKGFTRCLEINGVGYKAVIRNKELILSLGYSHDIHYHVPKDIKITCEKPTFIKIFGINKQRVGQVASEIRSFRKPEPYKGKGIKYEEEIVFRKEGKKK